MKIQIMDLARTNSREVEVEASLFPLLEVSAPLRETLIATLEPTRYHPHAGAAMKPKTYIETSVVSYLTSPPSRDIVIAGRQQVAVEWWRDKEWPVNPSCPDSAAVVFSESIDPHAESLRLGTRMNHRRL